MRIARLVCLLGAGLLLLAQNTKQLKVHVESVTPLPLRLAGSGGVTVEQSGSEAVLIFPERAIEPIQHLHVIWAHLLAHSDADTVRRLTQDPAYRPDPRKLKVLLDADGTRGFSLTVDQLLNNKAFWVPALGVYVAAGENPPTLKAHLAELEPYKGARILEQLEREPEASYEQYTQRWADMGNPAYAHPAQQGPGHIVCLAWDSSLPKFGIDRGAGVWNDYGNPDQFRFWFGFSNLPEGIAPYWKGQRLQDGLPVITTTLERDGVRYEVEQFAYPLDGPPAARRGDIKMVLLQRLRLTDLSGQARTIAVSMAHERRPSAYVEARIVGRQTGGRLLLQDEAFHNALLLIETGGAPAAFSAGGGDARRTRMEVLLRVNLPANGSREFVVKLPSPVVPAEETDKLENLSYAEARRRTLEFWTRYVERGAQFEVPEKAVNDMYRSSLWHALRLPRRHADSGGPIQMDLPYSNFAYDQAGTPWPFSSGVYVDYMLYGLRGYNGLATEELDVIYRGNLEANGHVGGYANWMMYTPGMLYAVAQNYLLSGNRADWERLLPASLRALEWCLAQVRASDGPVLGPLNDLTGAGYWAFNQAYMVAGVERFGVALQRAGHPRAQEALEAASKLRTATERAFRLASVESPLVELRDHTWSPYVPAEARSFGRLYEQWYPTDVDTGAVHLLRLNALAPSGDLADWLLADHEDNLYLHGWGAANEPVYCQNAMAYLRRDEIQPAIRAFYSLMASGFSHSVYEPVEHRWRWGQFFGPPSTDGAWFELYRNMLVREPDDETLLLGQTVPRKWMEDGQRIVVRDAPTYFGKLELEIQSHANAGVIAARWKLNDIRSQPRTLLVRLRHPQARPIRRVTVNGAPWTDFKVEKEWVRILNPGPQEYFIQASY